MKQLLTDSIQDDEPVNRNLDRKSRRNESRNIRQVLVLATISEVATKTAGSVVAREGEGDNRNVKGKKTAKNDTSDGRPSWNASTLVPPKPAPSVKECIENVKKEPTKSQTCPCNQDGRARAGIPARVPEKPAPVVLKNKKEYVGASRVSSPTKKDLMNGSSLDGRPPWNSSTRVPPKPVPYFKDLGVKEEKKLTVKELLNHSDLDYRTPWNSSPRLSSKPVPLPSTKKMEVAGAKKVLQQAAHHHRHQNDSSAMEAALIRAQGFGTKPAWRK